MSTKNPFPSQSRVIVGGVRHGTVLALVSPDRASVVIDGAVRPALVPTSELVSVAGLRAKSAVAGAKALAALTNQIETGAKYRNPDRYWTERLNPRERRQHQAVFDDAFLFAHTHPADTLAGAKSLAYTYQGIESESPDECWAALTPHGRSDYERAWDAAREAAAGRQAEAA